MRNTVRDVLNFHLRKAGSDIYIGATATPYTQADLYKEANRRFWLQTNYKVGQKLDPKNPTDVPYTKIWNTVYTKVLAEYKAGTLSIPITTPSQVPTPVVPNVPPPAPATMVEIHTEQAQINLVKSAEQAVEAVKAAEAGNTAKAETHAEQSNTYKAQADTHAEIAKKLADVTNISQLAYLGVKAWAGTKDGSKYFGWTIHKNGNVDTKWTDVAEEINDWFGNLGIGTFADCIWGAYWSKDHKDSTGALVPVDEFRPEITQKDADDALSNALGKKQPPQLVATAPIVPAAIPTSPSPAPIGKPTTVIAETPKISTPPIQKAGGGGGAGLAIALVLGVGTIAAVAGKKR